MSEPGQVGDKAGKAYWDRLWGGTKIPSAVDPRARGIRHYANRAIHEELARSFEGMETRGRTLVQIGCARSAWLPYFALEFGFDVWGLDYSEIGCQQSIEVLRSAGVQGEVVCADMFDPPPHVVDRFDVVVALGVVEHFEDTAAALRACARVARPRGLVINVVPHMRGLVGWVVKTVARPIYDVHVPLGVEELTRAHQEAGLEVLRCHYLLPVDWSVLSLGAIRRPWLRFLAQGASFAIASAVWALDARGLSPGPNRWTSPYVFSLARRA